jgi:hypothetical protein
MQVHLAVAADAEVTAVVHPKHKKELLKAGQCRSSRIRPGPTVCTTS